MSDWTKDEKVQYLKIMGRLAKHGELMSVDEAKKLSNNVKYALMELYRDVIEYERPKGKLQIAKEWFKRLLIIDNTG